ncbi:MAG: hypothetical protein GY853_16330 [PVC group bacterium]|nr:hypothetical protein [PVC group bacterium]
MTHDIEIKYDIRYGKLKVEWTEGNEKTGRYLMMMIDYIIDNNLIEDRTFELKADILQK